MNLHLMPVYTHFNPELIRVLNGHFPPEENRFVTRDPYPELKDYNNCIADGSAFNVRYINEHASEYNRIFLHYNFLQSYDIIRLTDETAKKIVWVVWGDDLYYVKHRYERPTSLRKFAKKYFYIWSHYSLLYGIVRALVRKKVQKFYGIGIGYSYDEVTIHKLYGKKANVFWAPVTSNHGFDFSYEDLRNAHMEKRSDTVNVLIGHSGFPFHNHEKSLKLLSKFKNENIHINLVMSYGASPQRVQKITQLAIRLFGPEKVTVLTEMMPYTQYCKFLASMDIALFPFSHQAALGNVKKLAYAGIKLYFDPNGALAQGFLASGLKTANYYDIKRESWANFCACPPPPPKDLPLFRSTYNHNVNAWADLLT